MLFQIGHCIQIHIRFHIRIDILYTVTPELRMLLDGKGIQRYMRNLKMLYDVLQIILPHLHRLLWKTIYEINGYIMNTILVQLPNPLHHLFSGMPSTDDGQKDGLQSLHTQ